MSLHAAVIEKRIVAESVKMREVLGLVGKIAPLRSNVLVLGESGTGKELISRAIHASSPRSGRPFVALNCGVIPPSLLESELFGYERGAFTGADSRKPGYFEAAEGGTILLDEISEMPLELQVKLLRVLQERCFHRLGGSTEIPTDVRVVASTNRDLWEETRKGAFRKDLFYRINVISISIPPLRDRPEDIPVLTDVFLRRFEKEFGKRQHTVSPEVLDLFLRYQWEGNVRELENVVECAVAISEGQLIGLGDIPMPLRGLAASRDIRPPLGVKPFSVAKGEFEKEYLTTLLQRVNGNISHAARLASLPRSYLYEKLKKAGVCREWSRAPSPVAAIPDTVQIP